MPKKIPSALSGYVVAAVSFGAALAFSYALPPPKLPGYVYGFVYVIAVFISAWRGGFGPGILASLATETLVPFLFMPNLTLAKLAIGRSALLVICSILISWTAQTRRRAEAALRQANEELEERVAQRTQELSAAVTSLQEEVQERLAAEQALRQSAARLGLALAGAQLGDLEMDLTTKDIRGSPRLNQIFGYEAIPLAWGYETFLQHVHPEEAGAVDGLLRQAWAAGEPINMEFHIRRKDGSVALVLMRGDVYRDDTGNPARFFGVTADVTERKELALSLEESHERLANVLESITDGFMAVDRNWRCTYVNRKAAELLRHAGNEFLGKLVWDILPAALGRSNEAELNRAMKDHIPVHFQSYAEALQRWFDTDVFPTSEGIALFIRDITERKRFNEQLRQTQKLESLGVLAGGVAHDFNNLLVGILGNSSLAAEALPRIHPARAMLEDVVTAAERASGLTRQLLAYAGKGKFAVELLDLSSLVEEITMLVQTSIPRTVQLRLDLAKGLPPIEADAGQMQQLLMNLVINGAEAIGDRPGTVTVATGRIDVDEPYLRTMLLQTDIAPGPYVFAEVQDTGIGMDEQTIAKIFDPFFTTKFTGRGLGLAAALGIVRAHKGAMKVYSTPGRGTTFKLLFPAALGKTVTRQNVAADQDLRGEARVLVVDDDESVRRTAKNTLERYGYSVVLAENGQHALELLRQSPLAFDIVLLDLTMPVLSGEDTLRELRKIQPKLRVILSSGFNEIEAIHRFQGKGLSGFVQKPYTAATLAGRVKAALTEPS